MDYLVNLYEFNFEEFQLENIDGIKVVRPLSPNYFSVLKFISENFSESWASEVSNSLYKGKTFVAIDGDQIVGFAAYDATCLGFFGPTGVKKEYRGKGLGKALLLQCLKAMKNDGYAYAVIGSVGPAEFYKKVCHAMPIASSDDYSIYKDRMIKKRKN